MDYVKEEIEEETVKTVNLTCVHSESHERILNREYYGGVRVHSDEAKRNRQAK